MFRKIRKRYESALSALPAIKLHPASALREAFKEGYGAGDLRADMLAGLVVGIVALPLSMALAIATGVPPQHGLYTAIIAGGATALLGGSRTQVTGPTAAFIVVLADHSLRWAGSLARDGGRDPLMLGSPGSRSLMQFIRIRTTGFTAASP
jgi:SulP family sulfate permease